MEAQNLAPENSQKPETESSKIEAVIEQSRAKNDKEPEIPISVPKSKGGRPKGSKDRKKRVVKNSEKLERKPQGESFDEFLKNSETPQENLSQQAEPMLDLTPFLGPAIGMPFNAIALKTGFEGFRLSEEEQKSLAPQVQIVLNQYFPQAINSPHAPAIMLAGSVLVLAATKYMAFQTWMEEQRKLQKQQQEALAAQARAAQNEHFPIIEAQ